MKPMTTTMLVLLLMCSSALAKTTVASLYKSDFPYGRSIEVYVDKELVYLSCIDNYLESGHNQVTVECSLF